MRVKHLGLLPNLLSFPLLPPRPPPPRPRPRPAPTPTPTSTPTPAGGPTTDDSDSDLPMSFSELFELALPEIGVQRKVDASATEGSKVASKQLQAVEHKISEFKAVLKKRLADPKTSEPIRECLSQCQENFEDAIDGVKSSIESIDKKNIPKANIDVSAVSTDVDTCNDCFIEMIGEDKEIKAFDDWVRGVTGDCLVNLQKH
uniref:uncharacterized protein LOC122599413 n=1 Tax=Erigeron canadensis TaxID=72917 RepID=UPI001CB9440C|nr:uncharacterized protein LOC122599413 [Erigeron canadensis]